MRILVRILFLLSVSIALNASVVAQKIRVAPDKESANRLRIEKATGNLPTKIETDGAGNSTLAVSPAKRFRAYVLCVPSHSKEAENCLARVFISDETSKSVYEVRGEDVYAEVARTVDELKWVNAHTLSYERWTSPHYGHRYVIDAATLRQTGAYTLSDR